MGFSVRENNLAAKCDIAIQYVCEKSSAILLTAVRLGKTKQKQQKKEQQTKKNQPNKQQKKQVVEGDHGEKSEEFKPGIQVKIRVQIIKVCGQTPAYLQTVRLYHFHPRFIKGQDIVGCADYLLYVSNSYKKKKKSILTFKQSYFSYYFP